MKFTSLSILTVLGLTGNAVAFAPMVAKSVETRLSMSEEQELFKPQAKVPCFGATPLGGEPVFIGENYWNKLTSEYGSEDTGVFLRAAELKHGRSAMLATVGFAFHKLGITLNNISPHSFLSERYGVKFEDLQAMKPLDAFKAIPAEGIWQMFGIIAAVEIYELTHKDGEFVGISDGLAGGLGSGGLTGDLAFNPLNIEITDRRRLVELQNGRAAMFAISAWVAADSIPGSVPLDLPWSS